MTEAAIVLLFDHQLHLECQPEKEVEGNWFIGHILTSPP